MALLIWGTAGPNASMSMCAREECPIAIRPSQYAAVLLRNQYLRIWRREPTWFPTDSDPALPETKKIAGFSQKIADCVDSHQCEAMVPGRRIDVLRPSQAAPISTFGNQSTNHPNCAGTAQSFSITSRQKHSLYVCTAIVLHAMLQTVRNPRTRIPRNLLQLPNRERNDSGVLNQESGARQCYQHRRAPNHSQPE